MAEQARTVHSDSPPAETSRLRAFLQDFALLARLLLWHWAVLALLRAAWLGRPDPFGQPLVGKFDWFFFHAAAYDAQQAAVLTGPGAALLLLASGLANQAHFPLARRRSVLLAAWLTGLLSAAVVVLAQADFEVMRFVGTHLTWSLASTYTGPTLVRELPRLLSEDAGGPYVGAALLVIAVVGQLWLQRRAWRNRSASPGRAAGLAPIWVLASAAGAGWLLTHVVWPGDARAWRLVPVLSLIQTSLQAVAPQTLPAADRLQAAALHETRWRATHPGQPAVFGNPALPLVHWSPHAACAAGFADLPFACSADTDGDGVTLAHDCDDHAQAVHPGATDLPGDGIDQDCNGVDANPPNFLVFALESHRALSVGHVPGGAPWSPEIDKLASQGLAQSRAVAAGLPTIGAFMAIHTGLYTCAYCQVATEFATARLPSLPATLGAHGYYTRFFSAFDPAWDNQSAWLRKWYRDVDFDRGREEDEDLFAHVGNWLETELGKTAGNKPFFALATTRTNHFPFPRVAGVATTGDDSWPARMKDTVGYTDAALGKLLRRLQKQPWFANTVVVVTGDHGYPLGEHGAWYLYETLHVEATGVPLVIVGNHPKLQGLRGVLATEPASHVDLAPTLLDLAGIDESGAWVGRSLLRPGPGVAITYKDAHMAIERGRLRLLADVGAAAEPASWRAFDRIADPREMHALPATPAHAELAAEAALTSRWLRDLYTRDAVLAPAR